MEQSCTIFYASDGKVALGGNNEDSINPFTKVWFIPPEEGRYGSVWFGFNNLFPQGGMNDQGLFYDGAAVELVKVPPKEGKPVLRKPFLFMAECSTVKEVIEFFNRYSMPGTWNGQYLFGDRYGNSAIIEPLTIIPKQEKYQIITNFYHSKTKPGEIPCLRYRIAKEMLENAESFSVELFRRILSAVHFEIGVKSDTNTLYSNIYDLKQNIIYVYLFHNYENVVKIDLDKELRKGYHVYDLPSLFPRTFAWDMYLTSQTKQFEQLLQEKGLVSGIDPRIYESYVGTYEAPAELGMSGNPIAISTSEEKGRIHAVSFITQTLRILNELHPQSESKLFHINIRGENFFTIQFIKDDQGKITGFEREQNGRKDLFKRLDEPHKPTGQTHIM